MINISNIRYGWAQLQIGYCSFWPSYLSDVVAEIDCLLDLDEDDCSECRKIYLEGETAGDLILVSYVTFESLKGEKSDFILNIVWKRIYAGNYDGETILKFPFKEFKTEWEELKAEIKEDYIKDFIMPQTEEEYEAALEEY